jgi:hypothetical protein
MIYLIYIKMLCVAPGRRTTAAVVGINAVLLMGLPNSDHIHLDRNSRHEAYRRHRVTRRHGMVLRTVLLLIGRASHRRIQISHRPRKNYSAARPRESSILKRVFLNLLMSLIFWPRHLLSTVGCLTSHKLAQWLWCHGQPPPKPLSSFTSHQIPYHLKSPEVQQASKN